MLSVKVTDLVRLDSEQVAQNYTIHAQAAERLARHVFAARVAVISLLAIATATAIAALFFQTRPYEIATCVAVVLALTVFALYSVAGVEARVFAHRAFAHRLWLVSQRYRALVAELDDAPVEHAVLMRRRDELTHELNAIYEHGFGVDQSGYEAARLTMPRRDQAA